MTGKSLFPGEGVKDILFLNKKCDLSYAQKYIDELPAQPRDLLLKLTDVDP